ncbi:ABC transporter permease [bacterium]|nr:ABC transporter permease [bacterium]
MTFMTLGYRSLFRQKRRTVMTLVVITFGIGSLLLTMGHTAYIDWGLRENTIHSETGHLQLFHQDYFDKEEETILQYGLEDCSDLKSGLEQYLEVQLVQARINFMGLISNGEKSVAFVGQAVEPEKERKLRNLFGNSGAAFDSLIACGGEDAVVLGQALARSLNVQIGDWVTLMTSTTDGALNAVDLRVVDTFTGVSTEYEKRAITIDLQTAQQLLVTDKVNKIIVTLDKTANTDRLYDEISQWAKDNSHTVTMKKWHEQAAYYKKVRSFFQTITGFLSLILLIIVFFASANTIVMSIVERTREIGTLLSLGTSRFQTLKMFIFEGLFLGIIGGFMAMAFAYLAAMLINNSGLMMPPPPGNTQGYQLMVRNEMPIYIIVFFATVLTSVFSSLLPAFRVTRMKIVDALGHI